MSPFVQQCRSYSFEMICVRKPYVTLLFRSSQRVFAIGMVKKRTQLLQLA